MIDDTKTLLLEIRNKLEILEFLLPTEMSLSDLSKQLGKKSNTLYQTLTRNYEPEVEFYKKGGTIFVRRDVALALRRKYAR